MENTVQEKICPGQYNVLTYVRDQGNELLWEHADGSQVLMLSIFKDPSWQPGDMQRLFVYQDAHVLKATTEHPAATVGQFAVMSCVHVLPAGAFLDWGIIKDLFVPYKQMKGKMEEGKRYLVYLYLDEETGMITGSTRYKRNPHYENLPLKPNEEVKLIISNESELGWNVVINQQYLGLLYFSDVFKKLYPLSEEIGYIKTLREDGKIDVSLQPAGFENQDVFVQKVLEKLQDNYGLLYLSDNSTPDEIKEELQMSKKNFKKAIGTLYRERKIEILPDKIRLL